MKKITSLLFLLFLFSCNNQEKKQVNHYGPKVVVAKGYMVPKDSMATPKVVFVDQSKLKKIPAGKPTIIATNLNVHIAGKPKIVLAGKPRVITPGTDTFLLPKTVPAIDNPFIAGIPETVIAKDMANKDQNPQNFSSFGKLQGLKHGTIRCMLQDKSGNLWFGTNGGVSKYDGKFFTSFSDKEGLANNAVWSILEDKSGNLWFGTYGGGVSKYDGKSFTNFSDKEGLANNTVLSILEDKSGNLWFGTNGGVSKYDGNCIDDIINRTNLYQHNQQDLKKNKKDFVKSFTNFSDKEGLANNTVLSILEDKSGNLWFGTYGGGLSKYDGNCVDDIINRTNLYQHNQQDLKKNKKDLVKSFTNFSDKEGLANNVILSLLEDKSGNLWFGTNSGVSKYDGKFFTTFSDKEGLANNAVLSLLEDKSRNLWFGTNGGVRKYDGKSFTNFSDKEGLANNVVLSLLEDESGNLWFGTNGGGVSKYDGKSFTNFSNKEGLAKNVVLSLIEDRSGNLWFGTNGGVSKYDGNCIDDIINGTNLYQHNQQDLKKNKKDLVKSFASFSDKEGLANNAVSSILEDKSGNFWFGTDGGGVSKYDGKSFTNFSDKEGLANNAVSSILEDKSGNLWFGTYGGGVSKYDGNRVEEIEAKLKNGETVSERDQQDLKKENGKLVKSFTNFSDKEGLANNAVSSILEDKSGNLWFGTYGGGVSKYDGKSFTSFSDKEGLANNTVSSILEDKSGNLWFGTNGGGVSKYDGKSFTNFSDKEGLAGNAVFSLLEDKSGNLWFGTRFGLSKLTPAKLAKINEKVKLNNLTEQDIIFKNYTYADGFLGIGVNRNAMLQAKNGDIWIGTNDRLTLMHPQNMLPDTVAPNIQLTTIELFSENIAWANLFSSFKGGTQREGDVKDTILTLGNGVSVSNFKFDGLTKWYGLPENLSLAYNNNYLTFNFIGITMNQPKNVKYQYKLEGIDENWSAITNKTSAPYGNLPHGSYTFKVKAMNSEGFWSKEFAYSFVIRPPWWQTWWAYTFYVLLSISSVVFIVWWNGRKLRERAKELEVKVDEATLEIREKQKETERQKDEIFQQKHLIEEKHKEITDSINYAERIQRSFLATKEMLDSNLIRRSKPNSHAKLVSASEQIPKQVRNDLQIKSDDSDYFIFFKPKDVVSGDFYWAASTSSATTINKQNKSNVEPVETHDLFYLATADSTGHGVPGAIMSLLNITSLEKAIETNTQPHEILNATRKIIIERLKKDGSPEGGKDGMDCSLLVFNFANMKLQIAAANNPVWIVRTCHSTPNIHAELVSAPEQIPKRVRNDLQVKVDSEVIEIKPDKMPVGKHDRQDIPFTLHEVELQKGDVVYTLTDGFADQFGGENNKKFMSKNLRELLAHNSHLPMQEQQKLLATIFKNWIGNAEQIDDVTVIGVRV